MPDGLAAGLTHRDFTDLIAYLESLRSSGQGTPGSGISGPLASRPVFRASAWPLDSPRHGSRRRA